MRFLCRCLTRMVPWLFCLVSVHGTANDVPSGDGNGNMKPLIQQVDAELLACHGTRVAVPNDGNTLIRIQVTGKPAIYPWVRIPAPKGEWDLSRFRHIETTLQNKGPGPLEVLFWAISPGGWDPVAGSVRLASGDRKTCSIDLFERWPGGITTKLDPRHISCLQIMFLGRAPGEVLELGRIHATGRALGPPPDMRAANRLIVPNMTMDEPAPGRRVRQQLPPYMGTGLYHALYLPPDWAPGKRYPVIVEYSGNIYYTKSCYSTGRPEDSKMGYGMSQGRECIWVNAPFVNRAHDGIEVNGWGDPDATVDYAVELVRYLCEDFGGDPASVLLTGFSRGAIACGYIGRRNDRIADLWLAFHACQHFDGDGWRHSDYRDALTVRHPRIKGRATFHTDNFSPKLQAIFKQLGFPVVYERSGLGGHTDTMFLEDRPGTLALRKWMDEVIATKPGTVVVSGRVTDRNGRGIGGARIQSGETHFTFSDLQGRYRLPGLIGGERVFTARKNGWEFKDTPRRLAVGRSDVKNADFIGGALSPVRVH